jgi:hypothetical protein
VQDPGLQQLIASAGLTGPASKMTEIHMHTSKNVEGMLAVKKTDPHAYKQALQGSKHWAHRLSSLTRAAGTANCPVGLAAMHCANGFMCVPIM